MHRLAIALAGLSLLCAQLAEAGCAQAQGGDRPTFRTPPPLRNVPTWAHSGDKWLAKEAKR